MFVTLKARNDLAFCVPICESWDHIIAENGTHVVCLKMEVVPISNVDCECSDFGASLYFRVETGLSSDFRQKKLSKIQTGPIWTLSMLYFVQLDSL